MSYQKDDKKELHFEESGEMFCIQPSNVEKFICDATQCDENCCQKWKITVDKDTYFRYLRIQDKSVRDHIISNIQRNKNKKVYDGEFASIKLNEEKKCPFQDKDLRCSIQKNFGEDYLSHTCNIYPRKIHQINGYFWQSIDISCSLVARLVLLDPEPLYLEKLPMKKKFLLKYTPDLKLKQLAQCLPELQLFTLSLIQEPRYSFRTRLVILGLFMEEASAFEQEGDAEECRQLIQKFESLMETQEFEQLLSSISCDRQKRLRFGLGCMEILKGHLRNKDFVVEYFLAFEKGLALEKDMPILELLARYDTARQNFYKPFLREYPYVIEKFFCNLIFQELYPFMKNKSLQTNFLYLTAVFEVLDLFLTGMSAYYKEDFKVEQVIGVMQEVYRSVFHIESFSVLDAFSKKGQPDIMSMLTLLQEEDRNAHG